MKRWWILFAAVAVLFTAVGYWSWSRNQPLQLRFSDIRTENGMLLAVFTLENHSEQTVLFTNEATLHGDRES